MGEKNHHNTALKLSTLKKTDLTRTLMPFKLIKYENEIK